MSALLSPVVEEIDVQAAYALLERDPAAQLVDVRTSAEWAFAGTPLLPFRTEPPIFIEWQSYPSMTLNGDFLRALGRNLDGRGARGAPLLFLCRSGARSRAAAAAAAGLEAAGFFNVTDGFQGPLDEAGHRGRRAGWQARGLPWRQG